MARNARGGRSRCEGIVAMRSAVMVAIVWCLLANACTYPATSVLIVLDTDAPIRQLLTLTVRVQAGSSSDGSAPRLVWQRGPGSRDGGITLPASFAVAPLGRYPNDGIATVVIEAELAPSSPGGTTLRFQRTLRFRLVPRHTERIQVFLTVRCAAAAVGCTSVPPAACTVSKLCEERDRTCGENGACVTVDIPIGIDAGREAAVDATIDASLDTTDVSPTSDVVDAAPDVCTPTCGTRVCGTESTCGTSCGTCGATEVCDTTGHCVPGSCTEDCTGRMCGPDPVCGHSCGLCPGGTVCGAGAQCVCVQNCGGRLCGPDPACGQSCGTCSGTDVCNSSGQCVPGVCTSDCTGRSCGPDPVCGRSCGPCPTGDVCNASGQCVCVPNCGPRMCGDNGCGGSCGACSGGKSCDASGNCVCPGGQTDCGGTCRNLGSDTANCGSCGMACGTNQVCDTGACVCAPGYSGSPCLPSCGTALAAASLPDVGQGCCPTACATTEAGPTYDCTHCCANTGPGACCSAGLVSCGGGCVDLQFDPSNCGSCGRVCSAGVSPDCCNGICVDTDSNRANCGGCGNRCTLAYDCIAGYCSLP